MKTKVGGKKKKNYKPKGLIKKLERTVSVIVFESTVLYEVISRMKNYRTLIIKLGVQG